MLDNHTLLETINGGVVHLQGSSDTLDRHAGEMSFRVVKGWHFCRRLGVSHSVIQRLHERFQATGSADERPRSGRPRTTNRRNDRYLQLVALRDRTVTARTLRSNLRTATNIIISQDTVERRLHEVDLHSRVPAVRMPLTPRHRRARMAFCRNHQRWNRQQWDRVLFTDESRFTLSNSDARRRV
nr:hypothetical protein BaRGS_011812 [Batillaria attramentaria]